MGPGGEAGLDAGGDRRTALKRTAKRTGLKRPELYRLLAELGEVAFLRCPDGGEHELGLG